MLCDAIGTYIIVIVINSKYHSFLYVEHLKERYRAVGIRAPTSSVVLASVLRFDVFLDGLKLIADGRAEKETNISA